MCSKKCAVPLLASVSKRVPLSIHTPTVAVWPGQYSAIMVQARRAEVRPCGFAKKWGAGRLNMRGHARRAAPRADVRAGRKAPRLVSFYVPVATRIWFGSTVTFVSELTDRRPRLTSGRSPRRMLSMAEDMSPRNGTEGQSSGLAVPFG